MWYIIDNGQQVGPLQKEQLRSYNLTPQSMVWTEGMTNWEPAANVAALADLFQPNGPQYGQPQYDQPQYGQPQSAQARYGSQQPYGPGHGQPYGQGNGQQSPYGRQGSFGPGQPYGPQQPFGQAPFRPVYQDKSRVTTGILALLLGYLGIQYFYIGKTGAGILSIVIFILTFWIAGGWALITFVQGIVILCMNDQEFERKFLNPNKFFPLF